MGDVYRARDTRLHRVVAIKIVSDRFANQAPLQDRLTIEAEAVASLNHPHICQLYDIGAADGTRFLVMELVDGETLAARLTRGALPLKHALRIAREIADALDAAHRRGIVHRDLKPSNVMLTRAGVKLLDFGLAHLQVDRDALAGVSTIANGHAPLTERGVALGTWQYMAPEQVRGDAVDARTDLFAFGALLYEMVCGRRAFGAASLRELVTEILESDPPALSTAVRAIPPALDQVIRLCLAKDPQDRWQTAGDVLRALSLVEVSGVEAPSKGNSTRWRPWQAPAAALLIVAGIAATALGTRSTRELAVVPPVVRSTLTVDHLAPFIGDSLVAFAPDGASIVYVGEHEARRRLYRRWLSSEAAVPIEGTEDADSPFFSPDGSWIGFFGPDRLMKVPGAGGRPVVICDLPIRFGATWGASWGTDDVIVASLRPETGLFRVPAAGGTPELITTMAPEDAGNDHRYPQLLPGGHGLLYTVGTGPDDEARIVVLDFRTNERRELVRGSASAHYVEPGYLVYARNAALFALPFDRDRLEVTGAPVTIAHDVAEWTDGAPEYSFSKAGDLVYVAGRSGGAQNRLVFVDLSGNVKPSDLPEGYWNNPRVSPDGRRIALYMGAAKNNIWLYDVERATGTRRTFGRYHEPIWTPDGRIAAARGGPGDTRLVRFTADGGGRDEELTTAGQQEFPECWSPDGRTLIFRRRHDAGHWDLWTLAADTGQVAPLLATRYNEQRARMSPDGRFLAYVSDESGQPQVYIRSRDEKDRRWQVSGSGGTFAVWAPNGRALYFRDAHGLNIVSVSQAADDPVGRSRFLFSARGMHTPFDVSADGTRFVMVQRDPTPPATELKLVQNWFLQPASTQRTTIP